jgi:hypothetical protein
VRDAILDPSMPDAARGSEPRSNALVRQDAGNALVVRFDLAGAGLVRGARVVRATASIFVWDPSTRGRTKVVAAAVTTPWDEAKATWRRATAENGWKGAGGFSLEADAGPLLAQIVVEPEAGADTADPPIEYRFDVTETVRRWHGGMQENLGLAIVPIVDRAIDEGQFSRFQIYASEYRQADVTPKLVVEVAK